MPSRRYALVILALTVLVASALACNFEERTTEGTQGPVPTVTPYLVVSPQSLETPQAPLDTPTEETPSGEPATPTDTPTPTNTPRPPATSTPTIPPSEGPLDFEEPRWVHAWEYMEDGGVLVKLKIIIHGGAPPFTISHGGEVIGTTMQREYIFEFVRHGCAGIPQTILVQSADGQSKSKDYWIGVELQPWCP